ncbi:MFS-type transporter SLC18B1-like [Haliotis cracherodii]|uniref:MFS-type transporter SLC18B1-like n=1 Tax=Haliotis cracherodii TaxID=6455 RepID=UPI0039EA28B1
MAGCTTIEDSPQVTDTKRNKLTLAIVLLSNFCAVCCTSLIAPFFAIEATKKGASETVIGLIYSSSEFIVFITSPVFGHLLSKYRPRTFYMVGVCVFGCCDIIFGCLDHLPSGIPFIVACFIVRSLEALGTAAVMTSSFAIVGLCFPERIATFYALLKSVSGAAYMIGPAIGGGFYELGGYGLPFWVLGSCTFACGCASCVMLPHQDAVPSTQRRSSVAVSYALRSPSLWFGALSIYAAYFGLASVGPFLANHLTQFYVSQVNISLIFMTGPAAYSLSAPLWGYLLDKKVSAIPTLWVALCCLSANYLFFGPAPFLGFVPTLLWLTILMFAFTGFTTAPVIVSAMKCIYQGARDMGQRDDGATLGFLAGIIQSSNYIGTFSGPIVSGIVVDHFGFPWAMVGCSVLVTITWLSLTPYFGVTLWSKGKLKNANTEDYIEIN